MSENVAYSHTSSPLYLITDGADLRKAGRLVSVIASALEGANGGIGFIQLREQIFGSADIACDDELLNLAGDIISLCSRFKAKCIINSRVDIVQKLKSTGMEVGIHLGINSTSIKDARLALGNGTIIGYSAHSVQEALIALETSADQKADYVFLSPIFETLSKQSSRPPLGTKALQSLRAKSNGMIFALGGITIQNAPHCKQAGASGVALISTIMHAQNPKRAAKELLKAWTKARNRSRSIKIV